MTFETARILSEFNDARLDKKLRKILLEVEHHAFEGWAWILHFTSIWRSKTEDARIGGHGIHPVWRAADVRTVGVRPDAAVADVIAWVNDRWIYDPMRPAMLVAYAAPHGTGPHIHFQVSPNTRLR